MKRAVILPALLALGLGGPVLADSIAPPDQASWNGAKQMADLGNGIELAYVEWGDPEADPVILVHGFSDSSRAFSTIAPFLDGHRFIAVDLRGMGDSSEPECCYYPTDFAEDLNAFIHALGYDKAAVVGHSVGSIYAGMLAALHPASVERLVLISSRLDQSGRRGFLDMVEGLDFPLDPMGEFIQDWGGNNGRMDEEMLTYLRIEEAGMPKRAWAGMAKGMELVDWTLAAERIAAPTLILWGDQDGMAKAQDQEDLQAAMPAATFIAYEGYGHSMYWENPEMVATDLTAFLDD
ncbi:alpha/beta fold hydrolase [Poseidonocella sp. HB161398]|uniref:alpha/beta fold hydrolase n=1 Tax=Poseidonocella sp. HB161398 TaxID=2320855 RepID=UPI001109AB66|nr:alpha/beta hydrolase [Poseidonocella sp. HB161398]